jgi:hypothetical protein
LVEDFRRRTEGRLMDLMTSDENPAYAQAIVSAYGAVVRPKRTGQRGRPKAPSKRVPRRLVYATVHKTRAKNRVVAVEDRLIFGSQRGLQRALAGSAVCGRVTTVHVERHNGTDRHRNARKARKTYRFSKDWDVHEAVSYFTVYSANFCKPVRTLRERIGKKRYRQRTPAMAAGLTDRVWSIADWLSRPAVQQ